MRRFLGGDGKGRWGWGSGDGIALAEPLPEMVKSLPQGSSVSLPLPRLPARTGEAGRDHGDSCAWLGEVTRLREKTGLANSVRRRQQCSFRTASTLKEHDQGGPGASSH